MSLASSSSYSLAGSAVKQQGLITIGAGATVSVPCASISATDAVLYSIYTVTAGANPANGTQLTGNLFNIVITAGTGFSVQSKDNTFVGTLKYVVFANSLPDVDV